MLLNPTAAWIWQHRQEQDLAAAYAEQFGISAAQAEWDVAETLAAWLQAEPFRTLTLRLVETTFELQLQTEAIAEELIPRLAHLEVGGGISQHSIRVEQATYATQVYLNGALIASEQYPTGARAVVLQELTRLAVAGRSFGAILHAGACGGERAAVILAGASFSGKSTLCTHLMEAGWLCLSDDSVCLTPDFEIAGMPFALAIREGCWPLFPKLHGQRFLPSNLGGSSPEIPARALIFVNYQAEAEGASLEPVDTFGALVEIQRAGFWLQHSESAISCFLSWLAEIPKYRLTYAKLSEAQDRLTAFISG